MPRRNIPTPVKASESVVSRILAKLLYTEAADTVPEVIAGYVENSVASGPLHNLIRSTHGLYPWTTTVAADIMSLKTTPLVEHAVSMPGSVFVVKDTEQAGADSLWWVVADPSHDIMHAVHTTVCRGLFHTINVGHDTSLVIAIQISSCQKR